MRMAIGWTVLIMTLISMTPVGMQGCTTTRTTLLDGTVVEEQSFDLAGAQAMVALAQQAYAAWQAAHPQDTSSDQAAELQDKVDFWQSILTRLLELQGAGVKSATVTVPVAKLPEAAK